MTGGAEASRCGEPKARVKRVFVRVGEDLRRAPRRGYRSGLQMVKGVGGGA